MKPAITAGAPVLGLHEDDNILVALADIPAETEVAGGVRAAEKIPSGHKVARRRIAQGETVLKYGQIIGVATRDIAPGDHVHVHNLGMGAHRQDYAFGTHSPMHLPLNNCRVI